jgi:membrane protein implicated in regulation of membrane protease activity
MVWPWIVIGLVLISAEFFLPKLVAGSVGLAALLAGLLAYLGLPILGTICQLDWGHRWC